MNYLSTESFESERFPGVKVHLKKMSHRRRTELFLKFPKLFEKAREIANDAAPVEKEYLEYRGSLDLHRSKNGEGGPEPQFAPEKQKAYLEAIERWNRFNQDELDPELVRWGFASIEGFTIDGVVPDVELLLKEAPPELVDEIARRINEMKGLGASEAKNSGSPTTSGEAAGGEMSTSTVPSAKTGPSTRPETAGSTFLN